MVSLEARKARAAKILSVLHRRYPDARCTLDFQNPLQLVVATILAAQCTDERVNRETPAVFRKYADAKAFANASQEELEQAIKSCGFYRNKAKSIRGCCQLLVEKYGGDVPASLEQLVELPGIGRKTANVVLAAAFNIPGIIVDTHVGRVSQRLDLTKNSDPVKIEFDLMELIPKKKWSDFSHTMVFHGRNICMAKKPQCPGCPVLEMCPLGQKTVKVWKQNPKTEIRSSKQIRNQKYENRISKPIPITKKENPDF